MSKQIWKLQRPLFASDGGYGQIWKLQRPLFASDGGYGQIMAYPEEHHPLAMITATAEDINYMFEDEPKIYVYAEVKRGNLVIDYKLPEEDWPEW